MMHASLWDDLYAVKSLHRNIKGLKVRLFLMEF